ncbi:MAG TPA: PDZ domain-containing protein, partial [Cyclobacteriaceae bacterium]|nr:PDZ domain-containing protein [Cyclobacteriaceae bacterium]
NVVQGVFVNYVNKGSAAEVSGLEPGDVITAIDNHTVSGTSELQEWVARKRPGQTVLVRFVRDGENKEVTTTLRNFQGSEEIKKKAVSYEIEGAVLDEVPYSKLTELNLDGGVLIKKLSFGKWKKAGVKENFIITHIDKVAIDNVSDLNRAMEMKKGGVLLEGIMTNGEKQTIGMDW